MVFQCPNCGETLNDYVKFCSNCGKAIGDITKVQLEDDRTEDEKEEYKNLKRNRPEDKPNPLKYKKKDDGRPKPPIFLDDDRTEEEKKQSHGQYEYDYEKYVEEMTLKEKNEKAKEEESSEENSSETPSEKSSEEVSSEPVSTDSEEHSETPVETVNNVENKPDNENLSISNRDISNIEEDLILSASKDTVENKEDSQNTEDLELHADTSKYEVSEDKSVSKSEKVEIDTKVFEKEDSSTSTKSRDIDFKLVIPVIVIIAVALIAVVGLVIIPNSDSSTGDISIRVTSSDLTGNENNSYYDYYIIGRIVNPPSDGENYIVETTFYDSNNKEVYVSSMTLKEVLESAYDNTGTLGFYQSNRYMELSHAKIELLNSNNEVVTNTTYTFDMSQMTFYDGEYNVISNPYYS